MITIGKHLSKYQTKEDYNDNKYTHVKPHISYIVNPIKQLIYIQKHISHIKQYFTIVALEDGLTAKLSTNVCEYRIDDGDWNSLSPDTNTLSVNKGQTLSFKGNLMPKLGSGIGTFTVNKAFNVEGNIMSLLYGDYFIGKNDLTRKDHAFYILFKDCTTLENAKNLILPATTLSSVCYSNMFSGCTSLTEAPQLPANTLTGHCYSNMFSGCTSLISAPELPATTLEYACYYFMFHNCTSLTTAPELPATLLVSQCYQCMFKGCTSLIAAPKLPATTLAMDCYLGMFNGCTSLIAAPKLPATTLADSCYRYMFANCTNLTTAPKLPATTLAEGCYSYMFESCSKLNKITMLATDINVYNCLNNWVNGVSSIGTFIKHSDIVTLPSGTSGIPKGWTVEDYDYSKEYFTIEALEDGLTVQLSLNSSYYSINDGDWISLIPDTETPSINKGQKISFKITDPHISLSYGIGTFTVNKAFNVEGNIMSLLFGDEFKDKTNLIGYKRAFYKLFENCATLQNTKNLILFATVLADYCYCYMFQNCTSLTTAPVLPATTLADYCYCHMFRNCTNLTTAPVLPATTITKYCYYYMFCGCTSLIMVPELPATILADYCYQSMFSNCTSLTTSLELPATTLASYCYSNMFFCCTGLTTAPQLPATILIKNCYSRMFYGCTSLSKAPELPATKLADHCYMNMFYGCTSLTKAPELSAIILGERCYYGMFEGCKSLTVTPKLLATTLRYACYANMFYGCTSLATATELPATTLANSCYSEMFSGCTSLTIAPELPATKLLYSCYFNMFKSCNKLNYIKMLATDISASNCLQNWVSGVASTGTFVKNVNMTSLPSGTNGIPSGWTIENA